MEQDNSPNNTIKSREGLFEKKFHDPAELVYYRCLKRTDWTIRQSVSRYIMENITEYITEVRIQIYPEDQKRAWV